MNNNFDKKVVEVLEKDMEGFKKLNSRSGVLNYTLFNIYNLFELGTLLSYGVNAIHSEEYETGSFETLKSIDTTAIEGEGDGRGSVYTLFGAHVVGDELESKKFEEAYRMMVIGIEFSLNYDCLTKPLVEQVFEESLNKRYADMVKNELIKRFKKDVNKYGDYLLEIML